VIWKPSLVKSRHRKGGDKDGQYTESCTKRVCRIFLLSYRIYLPGSLSGNNAVCVFWVETFFARNIADVRPLFEWMPLLLIFLVAAITMRMWSEERRSGTLEFLLTLPLPLTVSLLGPLDWGPVFGGYVAALFLAAAYASIGLCISACSANQIVSLIMATVV
jgi:ABC-type transport system involved in multi-copper enzyme maturation permease subunit